MGMVCYPIIGYGMLLSPNMINIPKDADFLETVDYITSNSNILTYARQEEYEEFYIYFPATLPWNYTGKILNLTRKDVEQEIYRVLTPYLKNGYTEEIVMGYMNEISDYTLVQIGEY